MCENIPFICFMFYTKFAKGSNKLTRYYMIRERRNRIDLFIYKIDLEYAKLYIAFKTTGLQKRV